MWIRFPISVCSLESQDSTCQSESLSQILAASVSVSGNLRPAKSWMRGLKKDRSTMLRSLPTCDPSRANSIMAAWLESWPASPARITRSLASEPESSASTDNSGITSQRSFAKWDPIGCSWKTSQGSMFPTAEIQGPYFPRDSGLFLGTWPRSGSMQNGSVYVRPMLGLRTDGRDGSVWPTEDPWWATPNAHDGRRSGVDDRSTQGANIQRDAAFWMTPNVPNGGRSVSQEVVDSKGSTPEGKRQVGLQSQSRFWTTPTGAMTTGAGMQGRDGGENLQTQISQWGTPTSRDYKDGSSANTAPTNGLLGRQVIQNWPTPDLSDNHHGSRGASLDRANRRREAGKQLSMEDAAQIFATQISLSSLQDHPIPDGQTSSEIIPNLLPQSQRKRLNSLFTVWMMGWPLHWLAPVLINSGRAETELWVFRARSRLLFLLGEQG